MERTIPQAATRNLMVGTQMGVLSWFAQRWTGLLLVVFLLGHLVVAHFVAVSPEAGEWSATEVASRLASAWFKVLDVGLLVLALYHGLAGVVRVITAAAHLGRRGYYVLVAVFGVMGIALLYYGILVFDALMG